MTIPNSSCSDMHIEVHLCMADVCFLLQATMVATWLVELLLDQINRALLEDTPEARTAVDDYTARLRAFLKVSHVACEQVLQTWSYDMVWYGISGWLGAHRLAKGIAWDVISTIEVAFKDMRETC